MASVQKKHNILKCNIENNNENSTITRTFKTPMKFGSSILILKKFSMMTEKKN